MTDKKTPDSQSSSDKNTSQSTENKASSDPGLSASISITPTGDSSANAKTAKSPKPDDLVNKKTSTSQADYRASKQTKGLVDTPDQLPLSKTAVLALLIALASAGGLGGMYWLHGKQLMVERDALQQQLLAQQTQLKTQQEQTKVQVEQLFEQKSSALTTELSSLLNQQTTLSDARINQLEQQLVRLQQNKSTDWLVHEAEYLIRISSRTLWLEKNTSTAINLLKDADSRLKELNDPQYLPVRQALRNDIESLQLLPVIDNESILLSLNALSQQVNKLPLAMVQVPDSAEQQDNLALSENTADWQENLAKTWRKFLADFITVRRRTGSVEPLMSPRHQQNLRENIMLKLQVAQWAVTKGQTQVYQQTLTDITAWINEYFDTAQLTNQHFLQSLQELKVQVINADYPANLSALSAIRALLAEKPLAQLPALPGNSAESEEQNSKVEITNMSEND